LAPTKTPSSVSKVLSSLFVPGMGEESDDMAARKPGHLYISQYSLAKRNLEKHELFVKKKLENVILTR
jgi:hypothetical protein